MGEDQYGHKTRFSDSSIYDEKCVYCGATDASGDDGLNQMCPKSPKANHVLSNRRGAFNDANGHRVVPGDKVLYQYVPGIHTIGEIMQDGDADMTFEDGSHDQVKWVRCCKYLPHLHAVFTPPVENEINIEALAACKGYDECIATTNKHEPANYTRMISAIFALNNYRDSKKIPDNTKLIDELNDMLDTLDSIAQSRVDWLSVITRYGQWLRVHRDELRTALRGSK